MLRVNIVLLTIWMSLMTFLGVIPLYALVSCFVLTMPFIKYGNSYVKQFYWAWAIYLSLDVVGQCVIVFIIRKYTEILQLEFEFAIFAVSWLLLESLIVVVMERRTKELDKVDDVYLLATNTDNLLTIIWLAFVVGFIFYSILRGSINAPVTSGLIQAICCIVIHCSIVSAVHGTCRRKLQGIVIEE